MKKLSKSHALLFLCWLTYIVAYLCRLSYASALPRLAVGLATPMEYLGIAASVYFIVYAASQLINGFIGDRVNPYAYIILAAVMTSAANLLIALSSSYLSVSIIWAANGFCQAVFWGVFLRLLSLSFPPQDRKLISTVMATSGHIGILVSWVGLGFLFQHRSWQIYFAVPGILMALMIPLWLAMIKLDPADHDFHRKNQPAIRESLAELARMRILYICLFCSCMGFVKEGLTAWAPAIFSQMLGLEEGSSLVLLAVVPTANILGVFAGHRMLVSAGEDCKKAILRLLYLIALCLALMIASQNRLPLLTVLLIGLLCLLASGVSWVIISFIPLFFAQRNMVATIVGVFDFSIYAGASLASGLMGFLLVRLGWLSIPILSLSVTGLAIALALGGAGRFIQEVPDSSQVTAP